ncbi:nucleotidyltransferase domain-containing protein [Ornithinibacillus sp. FSL M8-0202]|uniref:nucleotidyltransferase family protein n=1 Tax=Ornithinibacillus sp. FSL M8-0202 TaxID=2921616 RepID=UPI0030CFC05D
MVSLRTGYGLDANGFIISDVHIDKIDNDYMACIQESVECLRKRFGQCLHSVYVYGSVARGEATRVKSDLDLLALFTRKLNSDEVNDLKKLSGELSQTYRDLVRDVGIAVTDYDYTVDPANYYENAFLREICVCVYGKDVGEQFGPYKLTSEIAIQFNGDICEALNRALHRLETASNEEVKSFTQGFARKLIRTYYSMVMARSQVWTTRLHEQAEVAIQHFPNKESVIHTLLNWIEEPPSDRERVSELYKREGEWACANFIREANMTS